MQRPQGGRDLDNWRNYTGTHVKGPKMPEEADKIRGIGPSQSHGWETIQFLVKANDIITLRFKKKKSLLLFCGEQVAERQAKKLLLKSRGEATLQ